MAHVSHKLDDYTKQALWVSHKKSCFYCRIMLPFKNMHVDHIVPGKVFSGNEKAIQQKYGLAATFDFNCLENFVPTCPSCNSSRKKDKEVSSGIPLWLLEVEKKKHEILKLAAKIKKSLTLDLPDEFRQHFLSSPDFLLSGVTIDAIRKADIPIYKAMAFHPDYWQLQLTSPDDEGEKQWIANLAQYEFWAGKGYYGLSTPDIAMSSFCEACLAFFNHFQNALYLAEKVPFATYWAELPAPLLHAIGPKDDFDFHEFNTIKDYLDAHPDVHVQNGKGEIILEILHNQFNEQERYKFKEILQADFSGNGNQEAILFIHYKSAGTLNFTYSILASFEQNNWTFREI